MLLTRNLIISSVSHTPYRLINDDFRSLPRQSVYSELGCKVGFFKLSLNTESSCQICLLLSWSTQTMPRHVMACQVQNMYRNCLSLVANSSVHRYLFSVWLLFLFSLNDLYMYIESVRLLFKKLTDNRYVVESKKQQQQQNNPYFQSNTFHMSRTVYVK